MSAAPAPAPADAPRLGPIPGVPHNLGVSPDASSLQATPPPPASRPAAPQSPASQLPPDGSRTQAAPTQAPAPAQTTQTPGEPQPYRSAPAPGGADPQPQFPAPTPYQTQNAFQGSGSPAATRGGDRIATILLLVLGALGALYFAASLYQMPTSLALAGSMLGSDSTTIPESVAVLGTVGAIVLLSLYALTLIYSLQRLRARKLAFWVPLAAGALALVITIVCTMIGMTQTPELMSLLSDPDAANKLLGG